MKKSVIFIITIALLSGCSPAANFLVNWEKSANQELSSYTTIYISKLDIPVDLWSSFGYQSKEEWIKVINDVNNVALKTNMSEVTPGKKIVAPVRGFTDEPGLYVKLTYKGFRKNTGKAYTHNVDTMDLIVNIYDNKSRKELYSASVAASSVGTHKRGWMMNSLEGRIDNQIFNLCTFIANKLKVN